MTTVDPRLSEPHLSDPRLSEPTNSVVNLHVCVIVRSRYEVSTENVPCREPKDGFIDVMSPINGLLSES